MLSPSSISPFGPPLLQPATQHSLKDHHPCLSVCRLGKAIKSAKQLIYIIIIGDSLIFPLQYPVHEKCLSRSL